MKPTDLEALRKRWQDETGRSPRSGGIDRLRATLDATGPAGSMPDRRLRRGLVFDTGLKLVLLVGLIATYVVAAGGNESIGTFLSIGAVLGVALVGQLRVMARVPRIAPDRQSALEAHRTLLAYYNGPATLVIGLQSLTAPLFFLVGSTAYLIMKYGGIPERAVDDWLVLGAGTLLALALHWVALWAVHERQRRHLQANLDELEDDGVDPHRVDRYHRGSIRLLRALSVLALLGTVLLLVLVLAY